MAAAVVRVLSRSSAGCASSPSPPCAPSHSIVLLLSSRTPPRRQQLAPPAVLPLWVGVVLVVGRSRKFHPRMAVRSWSLVFVFFFDILGRTMQSLLVCYALLCRAGGEAFGARQGDLRGLVDHGDSTAAAAEPAARAPLLPLLAAHSPYDVSNIAFQRFDRSWKALPTGADGQRVSFLRGTDEMEDPRMFVSRQGVRMLILQRMDKEIWVGPLADTAQGGHVTLEGLDSGSSTNNVHKNWAPLSEDDSAAAAGGGSDAAEPRRPLYPPGTTPGLTQKSSPSLRPLGQIFQCRGASCSPR